MEYVPTGVDPELDALVKARVDEEIKRIQKNADRRHLRETAKNRNGGGAAGSPPASVAGSPGPSDVDAPASSAVNGSTDVTPQKGRGRNKDGTARKCANCGQVGHIKTNRKSVYTFLCPSCGTEEQIGPGGVVKREEPGTGGHGASPAGTPRKGNAAARSFVQDSYSRFEL